jgi:hypothetical protein
MKAGSLLVRYTTENAIIISSEEAFWDSLNKQDWNKWMLQVQSRGVQESPKTVQNILGVFLHRVKTAN